MVAVRAVDGGPLVGHPLEGPEKHLSSVDARVVAIFRGDQAIIPDGETVVRPATRCSASPTPSTSAR